MGIVLRQTNIKLGSLETFNKFVLQIENWWPSQYTWSKEQLVSISIEPYENGLCKEIGPYNFRCDWGRVTEFLEGESITFSWQIGYRREPIPNPLHASKVTVDFYKKGQDKTAVELRHYDFEKHGAEGEDYKKQMGSEEGWKFILECFKNFCNP